MAKRRNWTPGNYVEIPLSSQRFCDGVVTITEHLAVMDYCDTKRLESHEIAELAILFEVTVMSYGIGKNGWPLAGRVELEDKFQTYPSCYKKDAINDKYSIVDHRWLNEIPATKQCDGLEVAAAWDPCHIIERLNEHYILH